METVKAVAMVKELGVEPKFVSVSIQDVPMENWQESM